MQTNRLWFVKKNVTYKLFVGKTYMSNTYFALNSLQGLIHHKTQPTNQLSISLSLSVCLLRICLSRSIYLSTKVDCEVHRLNFHMTTTYLLLVMYLSMGSKHYKMTGISVWTTRRTLLKNKQHFITFHESILTLYLCLSVSVSVRVGLFISIDLSIYLSIYVSLSLSISLDR